MAARRKAKTGLETQTVDDDCDGAPTTLRDGPITTQKDLEPGVVTKTKQARNKKNVTVRGRNTIPMTPSIDDFIKWTKTLGVVGLGQLFRSKLATSQPPMKPAPSFEANTDKNRYPDVICLEATRVKLDKDNPNDTDYIHANFVTFPGYDRRYICTQGPLDNTIEDFWRMVWQEKSTVIVNLTSCCTQQMGQPEPKGLCCQYWPLVVQSPIKYGRFDIMTKKIDSDSKLSIYVVEMLPEGCSNSHIVRLIHTTDWPDKGVMRTKSILKLIKQIYLVDTLAVKDSIIIHCGAGVGRTGAMVLIDYTLYRLMRLGKPHNLEESFVQLRQQRASSIQQEQQFVFVVVTVFRYLALAMKSQTILAAAEELNEQFKAAYPPKPIAPTPARIETPPETETKKT